MSKFKLVSQYFYWRTIFYPISTQSLNVPYIPISLILFLFFPSLCFASNIQSTVVNPVLNIIAWIFFIIVGTGGAIIGCMAAWEIPEYIANKGNHRRPILITVVSYAIAITCFAAMTAGGPTWLLKSLSSISAPNF